MSRLSAPNPRISDRANAMMVPVTTIDSFVNCSGLLPDAMLIDVEGFEIKVLAGAQLTLSKKPGMVLVIEMHPNVWASAGTNREQAEDLLSHMNLKVTALTGQCDPLEEHGLVTLASTNLITSRT
jgi:hypothetical protein